MVWIAVLLIMHLVVCDIAAMNKEFKEFLPVEKFAQKVTEVQRQLERPLIGLAPLLMTAIKSKDGIQKYGESKPLSDPSKDFFSSFVVIATNDGLKQIYSKKQLEEVKTLKDMLSMSEDSAEEINLNIDFRLFNQLLTLNLGLCDTSNSLLTDLSLQEKTELLREADYWNFPQALNTLSKAINSECEKAVSKEIALDCLRCIALLSSQIDDLLNQQAKINSSLRKIVQKNI